MGGNLVRVVHPQTTFAVVELVSVAPDVAVVAEAGGEEPRRAVVFQDPDGEMHVYPMTDRALGDLRRMLDGNGLVVAATLPAGLPPGGAI